MVAVSLSRHIVYVDTNVLIYTLENQEEFPGLVTEFLAPLQAGQFRAVTSALTLTEVLPKVLRAQDQILEASYRQFLQPSDVFLLQPVTAAIADRAAQLRAEHNLKTPDAIHIATGQLSDCTVYLTRDAA